MTYQLYYWPGIQGRGEFVRLALEESGADYEDVARDEGSPSLMAAMTQRDAVHREAPRRSRNVSIAPRMPPRANSTTTTRSRPSQNCQ